MTFPFQNHETSIGYSYLRYRMNRLDAHLSEEDCNRIYFPVLCRGICETDPPHSLLAGYSLLLTVLDSRLFFLVSHEEFLLIINYVKKKGAAEMDMQTPLIINNKNS